MSKMKNIAILYICTGKYDIFWEDFYKTSEKYFLNNSEKHYFVFTDAQSIYDENCDRVHKIYQKTLGWPYNTLMRFNMFKGIEEKLKEFPDKDKYLKKEHDMKLLTLIDKKVNNNIELNVDELKFLYEIDSKITGFGYRKDPRKIGRASCRERV